MDTSERDFRYRHLARQIEAKIQDGTYQAGERLPSIRMLHEQSGLSITTVFKAFVELEALGLVEARPRSGYYVSPLTLHRLRAPVPGPVPGAVQQVRLSAMINSVISAVNDPTLLPLGLTVTDPELLPARHFARIMKATSAGRMKHLLSYSLSEGYPELRRQLALRTLGLIDGIGADDIIVTNGCMEAVALSLLAVTRTGDTVAIEAPTNLSFLQLLKELGLLVLEIPADPRSGLDIEGLEPILEHNPVKAGLFMPNFQNPLGARMPDENKKELVRLFSRRGIPIIEDEVSAELHFGDQRPPPLKAFDRQDVVLSCSSFSKTLAPGLRIGCVVPPRKLRERIQNLKAGMTVSTSTLDQYLVAEFLRSGAYERHLRTLRGALKRQMIRTVLAIQQHFPADTRLAPPDGGSLLWVQLHPAIDALEVHQKALEHRIAVIPGVVCSNSGQYGNCIQISYAALFTPAMEEGIRTLGGIINDMHPGAAAGR